MPGALSQSINHDQTSKNRNKNSLEIQQRPNDINYVQTAVIKPQVFQIPVIDCRNEQQIPNYKDLDHQRTKALRELTEQRIQQRLFQLIFL